MGDGLGLGSTDPSAGRAFLEAAHTYLTMQREHIKLEEELLPEAEAILVGRDTELMEAYGRRAMEAGELRSLRDFQEVVDRMLAGIQPAIPVPART